MGATVLPKEKNAAQLSGSWKLKVSVSRAPRKIPGKLDRPTAMAAYSATPVGSQSGAGHIW
jgi:hypothetical protein